MINDASEQSKFSKYENLNNALLFCRENKILDKKCDQVKQILKIRECHSRQEKFLLDTRRRCRKNKILNQVILSSVQNFVALHQVNIYLD